MLAIFGSEGKLKAHIKQKPGRARPLQFEL